MREIRVKAHDLAATVLWLTSVTLLGIDTLDAEAGLLSQWAMLFVAAAVVTTIVDWASRRLDQLHPEQGREESAARLDRIHQGLQVLTGSGNVNGQRSDHDRV